MALRLSTIIKSMMKFRNPFQYPIHKVEVLEAKAAPSTRTIYFKSGVFGDKGDIYQNYIQFFDVKFQEVKEGMEVPKDQMTTTVNRKNFAFAPVNINESRVKCYCKCPDMQYTFSFQLYEKDSFIGAYKRYKRVPGSKRPPRNPMNVPGFCKHTMSHLRELQKSGYLKGL